MTVVAGFLAALAALVAGTSGFGFGLIATPVLVMCGFSLSFVVTINLLISLATRVSVAWRLRDQVNRRRVLVLVGGALPGLWLGSYTLGRLDQHDVKLVVGVIVASAAVALAWADRHPPNPRVRGLNLAAGFFGGLLGTTTSLTGVPPALLLARRRLAQPTFFADLSVYFIATAAVGLAVLAVDGHFSSHAATTFVWWLPGVLVANVVGTTLGLRVSADAFRRLTLVLAFAAGVATIASA
jgi:uncharacterized membrane protein YfcA